MPKFFISDSNYNVSDFITIIGDDAHHISKTLRMKLGDSLTVTGSDAVDCLCVITDITHDRVLLEVKETHKSKTESSVRTTLFQALVKGDKMDTVIQKSVELGVYEIYPVSADRSVMKLDAKNAEKKLERWNRIALEASKQCGRGIIPRVHPVIDFKECVEIMAKLDRSFFCYELCEGRTVKEIIASGEYNTLGFFIGPEGGISASEAEYAESMGIKAVSLGKLILRTETAAPSVLSMVLYEKEL